MERQMKYAIGMDIGGTKISAGLVDVEYRLLEKVLLPSQTDSAESMFRQVSTVIRALLERTEVETTQILGIGIGLPGKVDRGKGIALYQNNLPWRNFPIKQRMLELFPNRLVTVENDVAVAAFGEHLANKIGPEELMTYVTISTGLAAASIVKNELLTGNGFSGELGLIPVQSKLNDYAYTSLEKLTSGEAIKAYGQHLLNNPNLTTEDVFTAFYNKDEAAENLIHEVAKLLAYGFSMLISILDPHKIVVGGSVAIKNPALLDLILYYLKDFLIPEQYDAVNRIVLSTSNNNQGILGAAASILK